MAEASDVPAGMELPDIGDVRDAAARLNGVANRTSVMTSRQLDARTGSRNFLKCECFQRSGSFKFRGAFNALSKLNADERQRGVMTYSSGNHAQAMALAGRLLGIGITVVMPRNAPRTKLDATRGYGAEIVMYDPGTASREQIARELVENRGCVLIPPFDHRDVVAGQGTATLELIEDLGPLDALFVPCGGGGLLSGSALAASAQSSCRVVGVEPELADDATRTFRSGILQSVQNPPTIADGLRTPSLGKLTWPLVRSNVSEMITVSEEEIIVAMRFLWGTMKLVVEPSGAVGLAGLMKRRVEPGAKAGVILSGGNVDLDAAFELLK